MRHQTEDSAQQSYPPRRAIYCGWRQLVGHESLDVTLAYLKGKDAESEEAQEHANSSSLAL